jgi:hypothetical protein
MKPFLQPATPQSSDTDFGRQVHGERLSLVEALRKHTRHMARAEAFRFQLGMGMIGFFGGLLVVVPVVVWMVPGQPLEAKHAVNPVSGFAEASSGGMPHLPTLKSVPTTADRSAARRANTTQQQNSGHATGSASDEGHEIETARQLIRADNIPAARRLLDRPELETSGQALFMLAETYDPNVLAALGATGVVAESQMARRYYEAALAEGVEAAAQRLEALE